MSSLGRWHLRKHSEVREGAAMSQNIPENGNRQGPEGNPGMKGKRPEKRGRQVENSRDLRGAFRWESHAL